MMREFEKANNCKMVQEKRAVMKGLCGIVACNGRNWTLWFLKFSSKFLFLSVTNQNNSHPLLIWISNFSVAFLLWLLHGHLLEAVLRSPHNVQHTQNCGSFPVDEVMVKKHKKTLCNVSQWG